MARTPSKRLVEMVEKVSFRFVADGPDIVSADQAVTLLSRQHDKFVRLVKKLDEMEFKNMSADFQAGQHNAYMRVLAALQQGGTK